MPTNWSMALTLRPQWGRNEIQRFIFFEQLKQRKGRRRGELLFPQHKPREKAYNKLKLGV